MIVRHLAAALCAAAALAAPARAQDWRTLTAQRGIAHEDALHVLVRYGAGKLTLRAADPAVLYDLNARFDADVSRFERRYDAATRTLTVGVDSATVDRVTHRPRFMNSTQHRETTPGYFTLGLARGIPIDLTAYLAMGDAEFQLGDLWISKLTVTTALSDAAIDFTTPNLQPMDELLIDASIGALTVRRLGNARAKKVRLLIGIGGGEIDLRGAWTGEMALDASVTVGGLELRVPRDAGVKVNATTTLADLEATGFVKRDGVYYSPNYETAARKVTVDARAKLAGVEVSWIEP